MNKKMPKICDNQPGSSTQTCQCSCSMANAYFELNKFSYDENRLQACSRNFCTFVQKYRPFNYFYKRKHLQKKSTNPNCQPQNKLNRHTKWQQMYGIMPLKLIFLLLLIMANFTQISTHYYPHNSQIANSTNSASKTNINPGTGSTQIQFGQWINKTQQINGIYLNHNSYSEGEVLLFRTKKYRHRAIPVMSVAEMSSKFSDSLTFKEWLRRAYGQQQALKVSVRTTEVVRPVLQHLFASKHRFVAPIIIHANTFDSGRESREKTVDPIVFIRSIEELVPEAVVSLGWTPSSNYAARNSLDWPQTFRLLSYIYELKQPAVHSVAQLEWLLGTDRPSIYLILKGELKDYIDSELALKHLVRLSSDPAKARKILFDVDESWRKRLDKILPNSSIASRKDKRSVTKKEWQNFILSSPHSMLSTSIVSSSGIAFLGWPNSLVLSTREHVSYPAKQRISGKVFIGYDGRVFIENNQLLNHENENEYHKSSTAQLPKWPCYGFDILDKGWRIEADVWSEKCPTEENQSFQKQFLPNAEESADGILMENYHVFLQLDTPITSRSVAVSKSGDGTIDFMFRELTHSGTTNFKHLTSTNHCALIFFLSFLLLLNF